MSRLRYAWHLGLIILSWVRVGLPLPLAAESIPPLGPSQRGAATQGMVVSAHPLASDAGLAMLKKGGNAVDAAVATTLAISVVEPFSAGIGGGGFLLLYQPDRQQIQALDFRERAPLAATRDMFLTHSDQAARDRVKGYLASGVPGTIAGLALVHRNYGRLPWQEVVAPALKLAEEGFPVHDRFVRAVERNQQFFNPAAIAAFTRNSQLYQVGERLTQPDLAHTLRLISADPQNFYTGAIAQAIATDMATNGGLITLEDLAQYRSIWREPLCGLFRQYRVCAMPPPSSGGVHLLQILNLIAPMDLASKGRYHSDTLHLLAESMRIAYADRAVYLGDPDFFDVPVAALVSQAYADRRRPEISLTRARPSNEVQALDRPTLDRLRRQQESPETSHLTVVDQDRMAVSLTFTVNRGFGSGVVVPGTGILLNDEMDDFAIAPGVPNAYGLVGGEANAIAPGKTPLSSMTPTLVLEGNNLRLAVGAPGGSTIITTVLQIVLNVLVFDLDVAQAVSAPRIHHQWLPDFLLVESGISETTLDELRRRGHQLQTGRIWGNATAIVVQPDGTLAGAVDPRGEGSVAGY